MYNQPENPWSAGINKNKQETGNEQNLSYKVHHMSLLIARVKFESGSVSVFLNFLFLFFFRFHFDIFNCDYILAFIMPGILNDVPTAVQYIVHQKQCYFPCQCNRDSSLTAKAQGKQSISRTFEIIFCQKLVDREKIEVTISLQGLKGI